MTSAWYSTLVLYQIWKHVRCQLPFGVPILSDSQLVQYTCCMYVLGSEDSYFSFGCFRWNFYSAPLLACMHAFDGRLKLTTCMHSSHLCKNLAMHHLCHLTNRWLITHVQYIHCPRCIAVCMIFAGFGILHLWSMTWHLHRVCDLYC